VSDNVEKSFETDDDDDGTGGTYSDQWGLKTQRTYCAMQLVEVGVINRAEESMSLI
jgi:hypothetical protein